MVGGRNSSFYMEGNSKQYAFSQMKMFWDVANSIGYSDLFRYEEAPGGPAFITDDHAYVNTLAKIPAFDIIATQPKGDFMPHHHTSNDNMSVIDRKTLQGVGQTILHVIYGEPFNY
jgi:aminopeptidase-like protein